MSGPARSAAGPGSVAIGRTRQLELLATQAYPIGHPPAADVVAAGGGVFIGTDHSANPLAGTWQDADQFLGWLGKQRMLEFLGLDPVPPTPPPPTPPPPHGSPIAPPVGYKTLVFSDYFPGSSLDTTKWANGMKDGYGPWNTEYVPAGCTAVSKPGLYNAEYMSPSNLSVAGGVLSIVTVRDTSVSGYFFRSGCLTTQAFFIVPGMLTRVNMQSPAGVGMWPGSWKLIGKSQSECDDYEGGYNSGSANPNDVFACNLHAGSNSQKIGSLGIDFTSGFHLWECAYENGSITIWVDGHQIAQYTTSVPTGAYEQIINVQVAQNSTGWHPPFSSSTPQETVAKVNAVEVWQKAA